MPAMDRRWAGGGRLNWREMEFREEQGAFPSATWERGEPFRLGAASLSRTLFRRRTDAEFLCGGLPRDKRFASVFCLCLFERQEVIQVLDGF